MPKEQEPINRKITLKDLFIAENLLVELSNQRRTVAVAEGCTGGSILNKITIPGSTRVFRNGVVAYSRKAKQDLGVKRETLERYGDYSPEVAIEMAKSIRRLRNDSIGIATVGEVGSHNPYSWIHMGFAVDTGELYSQSVLIESKDRIHNKSLASNMSLTNGLLLLNKSKDGFVTTNLPLLSEISSSFESDIITNLSRQLVTFLSSRRVTVSTIESCTGGAVADAITNTSGSSKVFDQGWVVYDENAKVMIGVPLSILSYGQVYSPRVSEEMALAIRNKTRTDIAISTTGTMDNWDTRPYHDDTPPGTVYYSILINEKIITKCLRLKPTKRHLMKIKIIESILTDLLSVLCVTPNLSFVTSSNK